MHHSIKQSMGMHRVILHHLGDYLEESDGLFSPWIMPPGA